MNEASVWIEHLRHPLVFAGFGLFVFALIIKPLFLNGMKISGAATERLLHKGMILLFMLAAMAVVGGIALNRKDVNTLWILAAVVMLAVAVPIALICKPADNPNWMRQYEEAQKKLRQQFLELQASGSMADDKTRQLLEAQLQAVQEHLTDIRVSWKGEQLRRKAADEALEQMKCQMPDAQIEKAQASLRQNDTKAAKETFAEVRKQAGKAAALAAHHEGKLAEGEVNYAEAMELYRTAVLLEKDNPDYLLAAGKMARKLAEYKQAQEWLERLLKIREKEGKNDLAFARAAHELASLYDDQGRYEDAEPLYKRSLAISEKSLGKDHPSVATTLNNLAGLYRAQGRYEDAEPLYKRSLAIKEKSLGKDHPSVATTLNNLAGLYRAQGRYEDAEPLYKRDLAISEKSLGKDHPDVATTLNNLAGLYRTQGRYEEAEPLYKRSLAIVEEKLGKDHPSVATTLNNLAGLYESQGRYDAAEPLYKRSLEIKEKSLGKDHPDVATTLNNLAGLYRTQGRYEEAEPLYKRSLAIVEEKLGKDHPYVAASLNNLAGLYESQGRYDAAEPLYKRDLAISEKSLGKDHPDVATTLNNLAGLYESQGRYEDAEPLYQRCLAIFKAKLPAGHPNIKTVQANYDELKRKMAGE